MRQLLQMLLITGSVLILGCAQTPTIQYVNIPQKCKAQEIIKPVYKNSKFEVPKDATDHELLEIALKYCNQAYKNFLDADQWGDSINAILDTCR